MGFKAASLKRPALSSILCVLFMLVQSCYSVRLVSTRGVADPDMNNEFGFYKDKKFTVIDTTITLKLPQNEFTLLEKCPSGGFYSLEYRVTLGGVLLSGLTFGKKRQVKVKYVCLQN